MKYTVIHNFNDTEDGNYSYRVGKEYPRVGYTPKKERIDLLLSNKNKLKKPLIEVKSIKSEEENKNEQTV
jgi:hypothetical protein